MSRLLPSGARFVAVLAIAWACWGVLIADDPALNALTAAEKAAGWKLLFDGKSLAGWRAFKRETPPAVWKVTNGELRRETGDTGEGGDLVTANQYGDFELRLEWRLSTSGGNSGIMFHVTDGEETYHTGPEFQILDNAVHRDGKTATRSAGANYDLHAPARDATKPVGEWNEVRLVLKGPHVEHWMNGVKLLEYELWSEDWEKRVQASKFAKMPGYGRSKRGSIVLQDHGNPVSFRNIKIRPL